MKPHTFYSAFIIAGMFFCACNSDIEIPTLPEPENVEVASGVTLAPDQLFGIWEGSAAVGTTNANHFEQSYRVEFQSVDDAEAIFSHWYVDASSATRDSVVNVEYSYAFDGATVSLTPAASSTLMVRVGVTSRLFVSILVRELFPR